jgi:hypothetical protein
MHKIGESIYFFNKGAKQKGTLVEIFDTKVIVKLSDNSTITLNKTEILGG